MCALVKCGSSKGKGDGRENGTSLISREEKAKITDINKLGRKEGHAL
jgi:hypothetical protein